MRYYINAFKNYANFNGRATRKEYWLFILVHYLLAFIFAFIDGFFGLYPEYLNYGYFTIAYILASALPSIGVQVRRLHDVGKSGSWWFVNNVPILNLYLFYLNLKPGDIGYNEYGEPSEYDKNYTPKPTPTNTSFNLNNDVKTCGLCNKECDTLTEIEINDEYGTRYRKVCSECLAKHYGLTENTSSIIEETTPKIMFCRKCGEKLIEDSDFCGKCGTKIVRGD